ELVLDEQVADLRTVAVGEHDVVAVRDQVGHGLHGLVDRGLLRLRRRAAVLAGHGVATEGDQNAHGHRPLSIGRTRETSPRRVRRHRRAYGPRWPGAWARPAITYPNC